jgi:hypothetical protein
LRWLGFRLPFWRLSATIREREMFLGVDDDLSSMILSLVNYFWFYFYPRGRGVGGGV